MRRQVLPALRMLLVMTLLSGVAYTAAVTVIAQALFDERANGTLVGSDGEVVGSELLGQSFQGSDYFHPRPSAVDYDPRLSGASNHGPNHPELLATVDDRAKAYRQVNGLDASTPVPVDAVTASASGLDPHISVANARLQASRVAQERELPLEQVLALIEEQTSTASVAYRSPSMVNVLQLNLALDDR